MIEICKLRQTLKQNNIHCRETLILLLAKKCITLVNTYIWYVLRLVIFPTFKTYYFIPSFLSDFYVFLTPLFQFFLFLNIILCQKFVKNIFCVCVCAKFGYIFSWLTHITHILFFIHIAVIYNMLYNSWSRIRTYDKDLCIRMWYWIKNNINKIIFIHLLRKMHIILYIKVCLFIVALTCHIYVPITKTIIPF